MFPPPDRWDPPAVSSHGRKCLLVMRKKLFLPLTAGTHQIWWLTCGPTKRTCTQGFCQLNQQLILGAGPLDVNPTAVLLLQPLFLLLSPMGGTAAVLPRTRTNQVSHSSPSAIPLPCLPHLRVVLVWGLVVVHRPWCARRGVVNIRESSEEDCTWRV